jgi:hypothetical protein
MFAVGLLELLRLEGKAKTELEQRYPKLMARIGTIATKLQEIGFLDEHLKETFTELGGGSWLVYVLRTALQSGNHAILNPTDVAIKFPVPMTSDSPLPALAPQNFTNTSRSAPPSAPPVPEHHLQSTSSTLSSAIPSSSSLVYPNNPAEVPESTLPVFPNCWFGNEGVFKTLEFAPLSVQRKVSGLRHGFLDDIESYYASIGEFIGNIFSKMLLGHSYHLRVRLVLSAGHDEAGGELSTHFYLLKKVHAHTKEVEFTRDEQLWLLRTCVSKGVRPFCSELLLGFYKDTSLLTGKQTLMVQRSNSLASNLLLGANVQIYLIHETDREVLGPFCRFDNIACATEEAKKEWRCVDSSNVKS